MNSIIKRVVDSVLLAIFVLGLSTCKKETIVPPTVKLFGDGPTSVNITSAGVSAEVTDQGGAEVKARGFAYGLSGGAMDTIFCGSGMGAFSTNLNNLQPNTTYVYEAFAKNAGGFGTSGKVTFTTKDNEKPTVKTNEVKDEDVTITTASVSGNVTDDGGAQITERGICWSTNHNPTVNDNYVPKEGDMGEFTCELTNLSPNTEYYVCAYAKNSKGTGYGNEVSFTTKPLQTYTIDVSANPSNGGTVTGGGTFDEGQSCTVKATENTGYNFLKWTENDELVSTDREYSFDVTRNRNLVANFTARPYTITVTVEPEGSGTIEGDGGYSYGDHCTLIATAKPGYVFSKWTEDGSQVSTNATYDFDVTGNRNLVAHFNNVDYTITAIAEPEEGGSVSVSGTGGFNFGDQCTLTATPNSGYTFVNWTKGGTAVSDNPYTFNVTESAEYVAHFQSIAINLTVSATPTIIAQGTSSQLKADASGGNGSFTYRWTPASSLSNATIQNPTASPAETTEYICTVTSGNETASDRCTVRVVCPPTGLEATVQNTNQIRLNWTAADPATSYKVYRNNTLIASNVTSTTYPDSNLGPGTYKYRVSTVYQGVESPKSEEVEETIAPQAPTGAINGLFSVSATQQVWFSKGNLQYVGSAQRWKFADNQWQVIGSSQGNSAQSTTRDLFGWGTSGWNCGNTYYRPWDTNNSNGSLYGPPGSYNLTGSYANSDWGVYNTIYSGNTATTGWRTLTQSEWSYVFNTRTTTSGKRYAKAKVNNVNGVILLPDNWSTSYYSLSNTNSSGASFSSNTITAAQWATLEQHGAVFLPAAGYRYGTSVISADSYGYYWSASYYDGVNAYDMYFYDSYLSTGYLSNRYVGRSVRLVRSAQ